MSLAADQLSRVADFDDDDAIGFQIGRSENGRKTSPAQWPVDAVTPINYQVGQLVEIWLVGLGAMRAENSELRKFAGATRAASHSLLLVDQSRLKGETLKQGCAEYR